MKDTLDGEIRTMLAKLDNASPVAPDFDRLFSVAHYEGTRARSHRRIGVIAASLVLTVGVIGSVALFNEQSNTRSLSVTGDKTVYDTIGMVLENSSHGPELCRTAAMSLPPQCSGTPLANWDWNSVANVQSMSSVRWVDSVVVTGVFYAGAFSLTAPARVPTDADIARFSDPLPDFTAPCDPPPGGWLAEAANVPSSIDFNAAMQAVGAYMATQPDAAGWWPDQSINPTSVATNMTETQAGAMNDPRQMIMVAAFAGDLDRHRSELRTVWPGAMCVTAAIRSNADRNRIDQAIHLLFPASNSMVAGTQLLSTNATLTGDVVIATFTLDTPALRVLLDDRFGPDAVQVRAAFHPEGT